MSGSDPLQRKLRRWVDADLLSNDQADAIVRFEATTTETPAASATDAPAGVSNATAPASGDTRQALAAEAIGYVGAALALGAIVTLLADAWGDLGHALHLVLVGIGTLVVAAGAFALARTDRVPIQRLVSLLSTAAVGGVAWLVALVADVDLGLRATHTLVAASSAALVAASAAYAWRPRALPQAAMLGSAVTVALACLSLPALAPEPVWYGLVAWSIGVAWMIAGHGGWLQPREVAGVLGGLVALFAVQFSSFGDTRTALLLLGVVTAVAAVMIAVVADTPHHLAVGAAGLFLLVPQLVFDLVGDAIGAPATLFVVGLLLVALASGLGRVRRDVIEPTVKAAR